MQLSILTTCGSIPESLVCINPQRYLTFVITMYFSYSIKVNYFEMVFGTFNSPKKQKKTKIRLYLKWNCVNSFFERIEDTKNIFQN